MRTILYSFLLLIFMGAFSQSVFAEIYKCKGPNGKIIYSESPCKGMSSERMDILDNAIDSSTLRREIDNSHNSAATQSYSSASQQITTTAIQNVQVMSDKDKQNRIRDNIVAYRSDAASPEKKEDAQYENTALNKAIVNELSYEDNLMRRNLKVDLNNADQTKRYNAMYKLRAIYSKY